MAQVPLDDKLRMVLGSPYVYFEPPTGKELVYPCIVYHYVNDDDDFADNIHYLKFKRYTVIVIDEDPDSKIPDRLKELPYCTSDRNYDADGLSHFVHKLYDNGPRIKEEEKE